MFGRRHRSEDPPGNGRDGTGRDGTGRDGTGREEANPGEVIELDACTQHPFEPPAGICGRCGRPHCRICLVTPRDGGDPLCKACAMAAAGVRSEAAVPPAMPRRELRKVVKRFNQQREAEQHRLAGHGPRPTS